MNRQQILQLMIAFGLVVLSMAGCGAPAAAPASTVPAATTTAPAVKTTTMPETPKATSAPAAKATTMPETPKATTSPAAKATTIPETPQATTAPAATTAITESVKLDDITMYYAEYGAGEPLILLHGAMSSADAFRAQVKEFAQHYRVITPDSRGQGRTTDSDAPLSYHLMAEDILRLMDYLKLDSAFILGWSDGAITGLDLAMHHPERVRALVAYGANTTPDGLKPEVIAIFRDATSENLQGIFRSPYLSLSSTPEHLPVIAEKMRTMLLTEPNFTEAELATIKSPTLILDGEYEEVVRIDHVREFAQAIPGAKLILMPGVGHYAPWRKAALFNKIVLEFLKDK